jgi:putative ABC transport system ATP-binding protein
MAVILEVKEAVKKYENKNSISVNALNGIDLSVEVGEFLGIMGPSGSGKTTLLNVISGIDKATSGIVKIKGENISM